MNCYDPWRLVASLDTCNNKCMDIEDEVSSMKQELKELADSADKLHQLQNLSR